MRRAVFLVIAILALALGGYRVFFDDAPAAVEPPHAAAAPARPPAPPGRGPAPAPVVQGTFTIADADGAVEVRRDGTWVPARAGDTLAPGEAVRTGDSGRAVLRTDQGDELTLRPRVELGVTNLSSAVAELTLTRGKVRAAAADGRERFEITAAQARAVGRGGGRFTVYADPRGAVTVASETGDVAVLAGGRQVTVGARQSTTVAPGGTPTVPAPVPDEVFLAVSWPEGEIHGKSTVIRGKVQPGSIVSVNGRETEVRPDGSFTATVPLRAGENKVTVNAEGIDGRETSARGSVRADTTGPPLEADPSKLYDPPPKR